MLFEAWAEQANYDFVGILDADLEYLKLKISK